MAPDGSVVPDPTHSHGNAVRMQNAMAAAIEPAETFLIIAQPRMATFVVRGSTIVAKVGRLKIFSLS